MPDNNKPMVLFYTLPSGEIKSIYCRDILDAYNLAKTLKSTGCKNIFARVYYNIKF